MKRQTQIIILFTWLFGLIAGCVSTGTPSPTPSVEESSSARLLTMTTTPYSMEKATEISTNMITNSPSPTDISLTALPSPTALPPIATTNARLVLAQFVQQNGGCDLPCILGLSPVTSNGASIVAFSRYFQEHSTPIENLVVERDLYENIVGERVEIYSDGPQLNGGGANLTFWKDRTRVQITIGAYYLDNIIDHIEFSASVYVHSFEGTQEKVAIPPSHPDFDELVGQFSLSKILLKYGKPSEIWILPHPEYLPDHPYTNSAYPFDFVLIYPNNGFAIEYIARVTERGDYLVGCPNTSYIYLASWNPEKKKSFENMATYFRGTDSLGPSNHSSFQPIQDVTSVSVDDFYEHYKNPNFTECVETPRKLWP